MRHELELVQGKGLGIKDIDLNKVYIWVNGSRQLGIELINNREATLKLQVGSNDNPTTLNCFVGDSSQPIRMNQDNIALVHLMVDIQPMVVGALLTNPLSLIIE